MTPATYEQMLFWIKTYRHFTTEEEGREITSRFCERDDHSFFIVRRHGVYEVYRGYWQREEFVSQRDFSISMYDLNKRKDPRHEAFMAGYSAAKEGTWEAAGEGAKEAWNQWKNCKII